jgi:hypothetical protein
MLFLLAFTWKISHAVRYIQRNLHDCELTDMQLRTYVRLSLCGIVLNEAENNP